MGLADFFRPKHKHSDVAVRRAAVLELTSDDSELLVQIAKTDQDAAIRKLAIERLDQPELLADIAGAQSDKAVRELANNKAADLWVVKACGTGQGAGEAVKTLLALGNESSLVTVALRAAESSLRDQAFAAIRSPKALAEFAKSSAPLERRAAAVAQITDVVTLRAVAMEADREVGSLVVDKLDDSEALEAVATKAKNKQVRQRARKLVTERQEQQRGSSPASDTARRQRAEATQLVKQAEEIAERFDFAVAKDELAGLSGSWTAVAHVDSGLAARWEKANKRFVDRMAYQDGAARKPNLRRTPTIPHPVGEEATNLAVISGVDDLSSASDREAERTAHREHRIAAAAEKARKAKEAEERSHHLATALRAMLGDLEKLADSNDIKLIDRNLTDVSKAFEKVGDVAAEDREVLRTRYGKIRGQLVAKVRDLRESIEWERLNNVPKQEALIVEATALATAELAEGELRQLGTKLKELQARWKAVGAVPKSKADELWGRFKAASDQVFERVKGERGKEQEKFAANAAKKEELITKAEALADSTEWATTSEAFRQLQAEWKASGHVPRQQGDELWRRFRAACDRFFDARKPVMEAERAEQDRAGQAREQLCVKMEALVAAAPVDDSWGKTIGQFKDLQTAWKDTGRVPGRQAAVLWSRFKAAGDALFAKRDGARDAEALATQAELAELATQVSTALAATEGVGGLTVAVRAKVAELGEREIRPDAALRAQLDQLVLHAMQTDPAGLRGTDLDPEVMKKARASLLASVKSMLPKASPTLRGDETSSQIADILRQAIAQNALGLRQDHRSPNEAADDFVEQWRDVGPTIDGDAEITRQFDEAVAQLRALDDGRSQREGREGRDGESRRSSRDDGGRRRERGARSDRGGERSGGGRGGQAGQAGQSGQAERPVSPSTAAAAPAPVATPAVAAPALAAPIIAPGASLHAAPSASSPNRVARPTPAFAYDAVDDGWDDTPAPAAGPTVSPPTASEMAGDGAVVEDSDAD